ncbi:hypothetical protein [Almyronema epifaneia]|uniref:Uncharacterized protein n=1 Tax=Almyronema epifaneia S1 TaxID=2991925 RepID=A0ABW6IF01_9CYAN
MSELKKILKSHSLIRLGDDFSQLELSPLKAKLENLRSSKENEFRICMGVIIAAFIALISLCLILRNNPDKLVVLTSATGLTVTGLVTAMRGLWKDKIAVDFILALLEGMQAESFESILPIIIQRF